MGRLLLFDCDDTLFVGEDPVALPSMVEALAELTGVLLPDDVFETLDHEARTARWLAREAVARRRLPPVDLDRWIERVLDRYFAALDETALEQWRLADGAGEVLEELSALGHTSALLTGVPEAIARFRMDVLGVGNFFAEGQGAFGCETEERADLIQLALERADRVPGESVQIGDTSRDVRTARQAGLWSVAVDLDGSGPPDEAGLAHTVIKSLRELPDAIEALAPEPELSEPPAAVAPRRSVEAGRGGRRSGGRTATGAASSRRG